MTTAVMGGGVVDSARSSRARLDALARTLAGSALWLALLLVTYWWASGGGLQDLGAVGDRADLPRSADRPDSLGPAARAGAADGAGAASRARLRPGPARPDPPAGRLHVVQPDARPHRADHLGLRPRVGGRGPADVLEPGRRLPRHAPRTGRHGRTRHGRGDQREGGPRRLRYESWHLIHLYAYLGVGLALPHQLWTGTDFNSSPGRTFFWWTAWALAAGAVLVCRVGVPLWTNLRHDLRVTSVVPEAPGVWSVYLTGRRMHLLRAEPGQFLSWRFLGRPGWTRANPYSLSAAPDGRSLRITVADAGDGSAAVAALTPGTRALVEGPFGRLTDRARTRQRVAYFGAGVGITPLRALAEGAPYALGRGRAVPALHRYSALPPRARRPRGRARPAGRRATWAAAGTTGRGSATARTSRAPTTWPSCVPGCRTWPSATCTSAGRPPGPMR